MGVFERAFAAEHGPLEPQTRPDALLDLWRFLQREEPGGFLAAVSESQTLAGYAIFVRSLGAIQRRAILSGAFVRWALSFARGRYNLNARALKYRLRNKLAFLFKSRKFRTRGDAQLLNIAVDPLFQGRGMGHALLGAGLGFLRDSGVAEVRLEVRPWNTAAVALYRRTGWREVGRTRDLGGDWIVMVTTP